VRLRDFDLRMPSVREDLRGEYFFSFFDKVETENVHEAGIYTWPDMIEFSDEGMFTPVHKEFTSQYHYKWHD
jgi:hypothetical protein